MYLLSLSSLQGFHQKEKIEIRIEDNVLVQEKGVEILSKDIPKTIQEIEKLINEK